MHEVVLIAQRKREKYYIDASDCAIFPRFLMRTQFGAVKSIVFSFSRDLNALYLFTFLMVFRWKS